MNILILKVGEFFGVFKKARKFLKGKKTIISSVMGMLGSLGAILANMLRWANGEIDVAQCWNECQAPGLVFWGSITFLWSAFHSKNVEEKKLGPGF